MSSPCFYFYFTAAVKKPKLLASFLGGLWNCRYISFHFIEHVFIFCLLIFCTLSPVDFVHNVSFLFYSSADCYDYTVKCTFREVTNLHTKRFCFWGSSCALVCQQNKSPISISTKTVSSKKNKRNYVNTIDVIVATLKVVTIRLADKC